MSSETSIYDDITAERERQDQQFGGPDHDDDHGPEEWNDFILEHNEKARDCYFEDDLANHRKHLVNVGALAVAAIASLDRSRQK